MRGASAKKNKIMRCGTNGLEQEPCPLGISAKLARQRWRTRSKLSLSQRGPPAPRLRLTEVLLCLFFFYLYATGRYRFSLPLQSQLLASRPRVVCLPLKFKDVVGDGLVDIRAPGRTPVGGGGGGWHVYVRAVCASRSGRGRKAEMMFAPRLKADGFFCIVCFLTARVGF